MTAALHNSTTQPEVVLTQSTIRAATLLGLTNGELARIIGVSKATVSRYRQASASIAPASKPGQLALLLVRVFRALDPLVGSDGAMRKAWMRSGNQALHGVPAELMLRPEGLVR